MKKNINFHSGLVIVVRIEKSWKVESSAWWFQGVGIEEFFCIRRFPHFKGVGIEEFHCIQRCPHFRGLE